VERVRLLHGQGAELWSFIAQDGGHTQGPVEQEEFECLGEENRRPMETGSGGSRESLQHRLKRCWEPGTRRNARGGGLSQSMLWAEDNLLLFESYAAQENQTFLWP